MIFLKYSLGVSEIWNPWQAADGPPTLLETVWYSHCRYREMKGGRKESTSGEKRSVLTNISHCRHTRREMERKRFTIIPLLPKLLAIKTGLPHFIRVG